MKNKTLSIIVTFAVAATQSGRAAAADGLEAARRALARAQVVAGTQDIAAPAIPVSQPLHQPRVLRTLLDMVSAAAQSGKTPVVMFDLDDTLLDPAYRNLAILAEFSAQPDFSKRFPIEAAALRAVQYKDIRYNLADTVRAAGVAAPEPFLAELNAFWAARFFDNRYLILDKANVGGAAYVQAVLARGGKAVYLTGRWEDMRPGTVECLFRNGFPPADGNNVLLMMKPEKTETDVSFKVRAFEEIAKLGPVAGGFENEPQNINAYKTRFPDGLMIFLDTRHSTTQVVPLPAIPWVGDFRE